MTEVPVILIGMIVMVSMGLETVTGFGATVLALPFLTMLIDVKTAVPLMSMMSLLLGIYIFFINRRFIVVPVLKHILVFSGIGLPLGMIAFSAIPERWMKLILGLFVTASAIKAMIQFFRATNAAAEQNASCSTLDKWLLFAGGIFHGAFSAGGPLMTIYVSKQQLKKEAFRATMTTVWVVYNTIMLIKNVIIGGIITHSFLKLWGLCIPFMAAGCTLGNLLHKKVSGRFFHLLTNLLLFAAGISTIIGQLAK